MAKKDAKKTKPAKDAPDVEAEGEGHVDVAIAAASEAEAATDVAAPIDPTEVDYSSTKTDKRRHKRFEFHADVPVLWFTRDASLKVIEMRTADISIGGVRLVGKTMMHRGVRGAMQLRKPDGELALLGLEVCYSTYAGRMRYAIGCQFVLLAEEIMSAWFLDRNKACIVLRPGDKFDPDVLGMYKEDLYAGIVTEEK